MKILLITNIPNPYRIPLFNLLNSKFEEKGHHFKVLFGTKSYQRRKFDLNLSECNFQYQILKSKGLKIGKSEGLLFTYSGIVKHYFKNRPERIIVSGFSLATFKLYFLSFFFPVNYFIWSGAVSGRFQSKIKTIYRKLLIKRAKGFIVYGSKAKTYLLWLGASESKIKIAINTVDTQYFKIQTQLERTKRNESNSVPVITYIGYLNQRKDVAKLIDIAAKLIEQLKFKFLIIGNGEEMSSLGTKVKDYNLEKIVSFKGFRQKHELPYYLAQTDLFLFQTSFDIWGLVLNEAMAAGCPCLASINAGSSDDLIIEGVNGYLADYSDINNTVSMLSSMLKKPYLLKKIGRNAQEFIDKQANLNISAQGFIDAVCESSE